jgi:hypothetical protein
MRAFFSPSLPRVVGTGQQGNGTYERQCDFHRQEPLINIAASTFSRVCIAMARTPGEGAKRSTFGNELDAEQRTEEPERRYGCVGQE